MAYFWKNKLKETRLRKGRTQYALAKRLNKSHWWISRLERGLVEATEDEKIKIAKALGDEIKEIFP